MQQRIFPALIVLALAGLVIGSYGMFDRLVNGLQPVAFGSYVPWGLWVSFYLFFLGLSAGAFLVTILTYLLGIKILEGIGPLSGFMVLVCLFCEMLFILLDLGYMSRAFYQFFLTPSFTSLLTWMFLLFNAMGIIYTLKTYFLIRGDIITKAPDKKGIVGLVYRLLSFGKSQYSKEMEESDRHRVHILAWISLPVGLLFYATNGAFFAVLINRPIWNSAMTPLLFVVAALLSGGALVAFLTFVYVKNGNGLRDNLVKYLGRAVLFLLCTFLALEAMQLFVGYQTGRTDIITSLNHIIKGPTWWIFWIGHLGIGSFIPLILLVFLANNPNAVAAACFLIFGTFLSVRYNFIIPDQAVYKLEGLEFVFRHARLSTDYVPNLNEWLVSIWIMSAGLLAFLLGTRYLPIANANFGGMNHAS
jgi:molybdopterin-containing oxidoreductase family membrane subunit